MKCDLRNCERGNFCPFHLFFLNYLKTPNQTNKTPTPAPAHPLQLSIHQFNNDCVFPHLWLEKGHRLLELKGFMEHKHLYVLPSAANVLICFGGMDSRGAEGCHPSRMSPCQPGCLQIPGESTSAKVTGMQIK